MIYSRETEIKQPETYFPHLLGTGHFATSYVLEHVGNLESSATSHFSGNSYSPIPFYFSFVSWNKAYFRKYLLQICTPKL